MNTQATAPQTTTLFPNLFKALSNEVNKRKDEMLNEIKAAKLISDLNHWRFTDHLPKSKKITDFALLQDLQIYLIARIEKQATKNIQSKLNHLLEIEQAADFKYFNISVEWKRSATWGANPRANSYDYNGRYDSGSVGGCGYDKLSTAVANVLNQSSALLKALYLEREKDTESKLQAVYGYGSGYGILPRFEGGVGVSCYPSIFDKIGFTFRQTASGKSFDAFEVTKKQA
jgi:hypothetical protein